MTNSDLNVLVTIPVSSVVLESFVLFACFFLACNVASPVVKSNMETVWKHPDNVVAERRVLYAKTNPYTTNQQ